MDATGESMMQSMTVALAALDLDLNNPRINPAEHQTEALKLILLAESVGDRVGEKVFALAKSICELGSTDPSEKLIALANSESPGRYTVLDGNRRVAALRLLTEPAILDREDIGIPANLRRRMHALRSQYDVKDVPTTLEISIFPSREAAEPFLALKHTGERDGAGRSSWSAMQQARFEMTGTYQLLVRLRSDQLLNAETNRQIDSSEFAISTFSRVAASSDFAARFGGRISSDAYDEGNDPTLSTLAWAQVANDTATGAVTSRSHSSTEEIKPYLEAINAQIVSTTEEATPDPEVNSGSPTGNGLRTSDDSIPTAAPDKPAPYQAATDGPRTGPANPPTGSPQAPNPAPTTPRVRAPRVRQYLIDKRSPLPVTQQKCKKIHDELMESVKVSEAPYACAFLVRAFVEMTSHHYLTHFGLSLPKHATDKIQAMAQDLISQPRLGSEPADRKTIGVALNKDANVYDDLSVAAHNVHSSLAPDHVRATWESIQPALRLAWQRISGSPGAGQR